MGKRWSDLSAGQKRFVVLGGAAELALKAAALVDIYRREDDGVRGKKWMWVAALFVNTFGPISYFVFGRRR